MKMAPILDNVHQWQARAFEQGTKQASMFAVGIPFIVISSIVVGLRVHVRLNLLKMKLAWDDCKSNPGRREYAFDLRWCSSLDDHWNHIHDRSLGSEHDM